MTTWFRKQECSLTRRTARPFPEGYFFTEILIVPAREMAGDQNAGGPAVQSHFEERRTEPRPVTGRQDLG